MLSMLRKGWVDIIRKNHLKFTQKLKKDKCSEISNVVKKNNENVTRKKKAKAQTMRVE